MSEIMPKVIEAVHMRPSKGTCEVHAWPSEGMGRRLVEALRAGHGRGGVDVCRECLGRARGDAHRVVAEERGAQG